ncbi:MAG: ABC transporter permease [Patescibacteria group bacterium]
MKIIKNVINNLKAVLRFVLFLFSKDFLVKFKNTVIRFGSFLILLISYLVMVVLIKISSWRYFPKFLTKLILPPVSKAYDLLLNLNRHGENTINRVNLIELALRNMKFKATRTLITIGGVSIGIAAIVFLVSLGYGLQELVVSRVARLDELKQADVATQPGSKVQIDDKTISDVKAFTNVSEVYPLIAVVGRVNYQNSVSDMAVYGVTRGYLEQSAIKPVKGDLFESNDLSIAYAPPEAGQNQEAVQGVSDERDVISKHGDKINDVDVALQHQEWFRVRSGPGTSNSIIGYTKRPEGTLYGETYYGESYEDEESFGSFGTDSEGNSLGVWVLTKVNLWEEIPCDTNNVDCVDGTYLLVRDAEGNKVQSEGFLAHINLKTRPINFNQGDVLGESDTQVAANASTTIEATSDAIETTANALFDLQVDPNSEWVELPGESVVPVNEVNTVKLSDSAVKEAVVNRAMLQILGINEEEAIGKTFSAVFVIPSDLVSDSEKRVESEPEEYVIKAVIPGEGAPLFYVPFVDLRSLGIVNYSQFKVAVNKADSLDLVRKQIESLGYTTQSVVDTVAQINSLFGTLRLILGIMGMVALTVASLGMFNTLTVSLLERTREVGLMKAMGMKTSEVQELFLTESIIMGFCAGFGGLFVGAAAGKLLGLVLTMFSLFKGEGYIDISYVPLSFVLIIVVLSFFVGMLTGVYPAKRSKNISALDALRYE